MEFIEQKKREVEQWVRRQPPHVEVAAATASGAAQGALIGGLMATFSSMEPPPVAGGMPPPPKVRQASLPLPRACLIAPLPLPTSSRRVWLVAQPFWPATSPL